MMQVLDPLVYFNNSVSVSLSYLYNFLKFDDTAWHVTTVTMMLN